MTRRESVVATPCTTTANSVADSASISPATETTISPSDRFTLKHAAFSIIDNPSDPASTLLNSGGHRSRPKRRPAVNR